MSRYYIQYEGQKNSDHDIVIYIIHVLFKLFCFLASSQPLIIPTYINIIINVDFCHLKD